MATTKKAVTIRFQPNIYRKLKAIAEYEKRSVTNLVEYLSEKHIENYETKNGKLNVFNVQQGDNNNFQTSVSST